MKKFKVGKYYTPATVPSIEPLECVSSTDFYVTFRDSEKCEYIKVKKGGWKNENNTRKNGRYSRSNG